MNSVSFTTTFRELSANNRISIKFERKQTLLSFEIKVFDANEVLLETRLHKFDVTGKRYPINIGCWCNSDDTYKASLFTFTTGRNALQIIKDSSDIEYIPISDNLSFATMKQLFNFIDHYREELERARKEYER